MDLIRNVLRIGIINALGLIIFTNNTFYDLNFFVVKSNWHNNGTFNAN